MIFETVKSEGLAHLSYLLGDAGSGVAAVIDPRRDVEVYLDLARRHEVRITHILETHIHADFVSGSRELAARTGAPIYAGTSGDYGFPHEPLRGGDVLEVGPFALRVLPTPGHSPEHVSFVVRGGGKGAEHDWAVFTGDALFAGEVGRPDLAEGDPREQTRQLYRALHDELLPLGDALEVYPAHGEGSPCGGSIGARDRTTLGYERRYNPKLQAEGEDAFVEAVLGGLSQEPFYYERLKRVNAEGPPVLGAWPYLQPLSPEAFRQEMQREGAIVLDVREITTFAAAHIEGALNIALRKSFPVWAGWTLRPEQRLLLVAEEAAHVDAVQRHLLRTGFDHIGGYLQQGMRGWIEAGLPFARGGEMSVHDLKRHLETGRDGLQILDVRSDEEWEQGHIPTARHVWAPFLEEHLDELDRQRPVAVYCGSGYRASIAASMLRRHGFDRVSNVPGSMSAWKAADYPLEQG